MMPPVSGIYLWFVVGNKHAEWVAIDPYNGHIKDKTESETCEKDKPPPVYIGKTGETTQTSILPPALPSSVEGSFIFFLPGL